MINSHLIDVVIYPAIEKYRNSTVRKISIYILEKLNKINSIKIMKKIKLLINLH